MVTIVLRFAMYNMVIMVVSEDPIQYSIAPPHGVTRSNITESTQKIKHMLCKTGSNLN